MMQQTQNSICSRHYASIKYSERMALVHLVENQNLPISSAAKIKQIKLSTAKLIISRYRKTGKVFIRRQQRVELKKSLKKQHLQQRPTEVLHSQQNQFNQLSLSYPGFFISQTTPLAFPPQSFIPVYLFFDPTILVPQTRIL